MLIRLVLIAAILWLALLFSGYGILIKSHAIAGGLGLECRYMTARNIVTAHYIHTDSGIIGQTSCPVLRKSEQIVDHN